MKILTVAQKENSKSIKTGAKTYTVFNAQDIEGIPPIIKNEVENVNKLADSVLKSYLENEKITFHEKGDRAFYDCECDEITIPEKKSFYDEYGYLSVLAHEICHSTGDEKRLDRSSKNTFGTKDYALEEMRAEIASSFLCSDLELEIATSDVQNHKEYIQSWIQIIEEAPLELFKAINESQHISDFVLERGDYELNKGLEELSEEKDLDFSLEN